MTEDQIERAVELAFAALEKFSMDPDSLMAPMVQAAAAEITAWAEQQYALLALREMVR